MTKCGHSYLQSSPKEVKYDRKKIIEVANSVSILDDSSPIANKDLTSDNALHKILDVMHYGRGILWGLGESKESKDNKLSQDDNKIHIFNHGFEPLEGE